MTVESIIWKLATTGGNNGLQLKNEKINQQKNALIVTGKLKMNNRAGV